MKLLSGLSPMRFIKCSLIMRIMGLDIGTKYIGVAISDETGILAQGRETILRVNEKLALERIKDLVEEYKVKEIVVGLPINLDGTEGVRAKDSIKFSENLKLTTALPIELWDERFSTKEAEAVMIKASVRRKKRKQVIDKMAAQIILQSYLDSRERG